jgi:hypothetical protein
MRKMYFLFACLIAVISANFYPAKASANGSKDNFFPVAQVVLTPVFLCEDAGFSLLMEGGPRSYRFNGTVGFISCEQHRFKVGGEYLAQKFRHENHEHHSHDWEHQWAVGGKYQYLFLDDCCNWLKYFQLGGYYAKSKNNEHEHHHIVGAKSWGIEAGSAIDTCWNNGSLYFAINYDQIKFNKHHHSHKDINGVGATIALDQPLWCDVTLGIEYQYKRAYDFIEALLNWTNRMECGDLTLGIFYDHVWGKERINSSDTLGLSLGFTFGMDNWSLFGDCCAPCNTDCCVADCSDLAEWISRPAIYMPQVITRTVSHNEEDGGGDGGGDGANNPNDGASNPNDGAVANNDDATNAPATT